MEIIMSIQVYLISWMNTNYKENSGKKAFVANPRHQYPVSQCGERDCNAHNKKMEIIMSIQVCLILWVNANYKENGGKKRFYCKSKASISCIPM